MSANLKSRVDRLACQAQRRQAVQQDGSAVLTPARLALWDAVDAALLVELPDDPGGDDFIRRLGAGKETAADREILARLPEGGEAHLRELADAQKWANSNPTHPLVLKLKIYGFQCDPR